MNRISESHKENNCFGEMFYMRERDLCFLVL
jgi:hypothetical protein